MALHILQCEKSGKFTLGKRGMGEKAVNPLPPKFSPDDAYGKYRREVKERERKEKDLL